MPFPFVPAALLGLGAFALLFKHRPPSSETKPPEPVGPVNPNVPPPPPPPPPEVFPGPIPKFPGTDRPIADNVTVVDAPHGLRVREEPNTSSRVISFAPNGSIVTVLEFDVDAPPPPADDQHSEQFGWARVRVNANTQGFVAARFLSSSGATGLGEIARQQKERRESEAERPVEPPVEIGAVYSPYGPHAAYQRRFQRLRVLRHRRRYMGG